MTDETLPRPTRDREIASTQDGIDITRGYTGPLLVPADRILRTRGGGDLSIYEQVLSEPQVHTTFQQRRLAVVNREWAVEPASDRRADKKAAEFIRAQLQRVGFDARTDRMLYGVFYGYAVAEMLYGVENGQIVWNAIKVRNRRRFRFTPDGALRLLTVSNMLEGIELPKEKFWHFATGADHDDEPYGVGLGHWCYWPTLFKRNGIKFWLNFVEKFAQPTGVGEYDSGATEPEKSKLLAAVRAIQTDSGIIIPKGMVVRLMEAARSGTADYKTLHDTMEETIAKVVLGQVASTQGQAGKLGEEQLQSDVRAELVKADADLVCESLNLGPIRWLTHWNFADADPPRVYRVLDDPEDMTARATRDKAVFDMGFRPSLRYVQDTYGGEWTEAQATPPEGVLPPQESEFAAGDEEPDPQAERLAEEATLPWSDVLDAVHAMVERADSLPALREALLSAYGELPLQRLSEVIAMAAAAAELRGAFDLHQESARG
ncbi:MAG: DUF935 family protein [Xanthomonadales bacterium]|nr:DUF935 family protein [Xanthomonadales bacterium]